MSYLLMRGWGVISLTVTVLSTLWLWDSVRADRLTRTDAIGLVFLDTSAIGVVTSISIASVVFAFCWFQSDALDGPFDDPELLAGFAWYPLYWIILLFSAASENSIFLVLYVAFGFPALIFTALMGIPVSITAIYLSFHSFFSVIFKIFSGLWSAGVWVYTLFIRVPGTDIAQKHASNIHPSDTTERRLAQAVREGSASDREIAQYSHTLPFWSRRLHTFKYKKKAEKYRKVNKLLKEQKGVVDARTEMAYHAHELEKAKRKLKNAKKSYK